MAEAFKARTKGRSKRIETTVTSGPGGPEGGRAATAFRVYKAAIVDRGAGLAADITSIPNSSMPRSLVDGLRDVRVPERGAKGRH